MKATTVALLAACLLGAVALAEEAAASQVIVLTDDNFEKIVAEHEILLVEFYAPWCGHCKTLEPKYDEAAKILAEDKETAGKIFIAKLDATEAKKAAGKFGVSGFPTLKLLRNGEAQEDYKGDREAQAIVDYMKKKAAGTPNKEITSLDELKKATKAKFVTKTTIVGFFASKDGVDFKIFKSVVAGLADSGIDIFHTADPAVLEGVGFYSSGSSIQMFRPSAKPFKVTYSGTLFKQTLKEWIIAQALPLVATYNAESSKLFEMVEKNIVRVVAADPAAVDAKALAALAEENKGMLFATSDAADFASDVEAHCGKDAKVCVLAQEHSKKGGKIFGMEGAYTAENVKAFVADFAAKKLTQKVKSEAAAPAPEAGKVAVVVGTTFDAIVMDEKKDVMIEFYAPWCGHCKQLTPKYEELAKNVGEYFNDLVIAKMDQTVNDIPEKSQGLFKVEGFPTIYFAGRGDKKKAPVTFDGTRDAAAMEKWIKEQREIA
jgi:protein disulfide isomerase